MDVLLVEDDSHMSTLLKGTLESRGHTVTAVGTGELGWDRYQHQHFPMIILDWLLPGMDGLEVCRKIRSSPQGKDCLILVITVRTNPGDLEMVLAAGADDYLTKPVDLSLLNIRLGVAEQRAKNLALQQRYESESTAAKNQLAATLAALPDLLFELDLEGRYLDYRSSRDDLLAAPAETLLGKTVHETLPPEVANEIMSALKEAHLTGRSNGKQIELQVPQGKLWFELSIAKMPDKTELAPHFIVLSRDITKRKQMELALRTSETSLKEAQRIAQVGNWKLDLVTGKLDWSDEVYRLFEIEPHQFGATYEAFLNAVHPEDRDKVNQAYTHSLATHLPYAISHRLLMNDGRIKWVEERCSTEYNTENKPLFSWGTVQDITERKQTEYDLITAKNMAEEASRTKSEFLSRMSHELRTPLNAIIGFAQFMELGSEEETVRKHRDHIKTIVRSGWHLLRIIEDLLNLSAIEAKKVELHIDNIDVRLCMEECFKLMAPLAGERKLELACANDECDGVIVKADVFRLKQVMINLLPNAIKYNRHGGNITVCGERSAEHIRILISDTGPGIPADQIASLFEPFSRLTQRPYSIEGAGIGLSVAKQLTELMGGKIGVESIVGQGSTFWVELPAAEANAKVATTPASYPQSEMFNDKTTLLYIEDNPDHINLVRAIVSRMDNLSLLVAHTPTLGLDLARTQQPGLILIDICLPGMSGYEVLERLQANARTSHIPVMAVSASASPHEIEKGLLAGFRRYLTKPLKVEEFSQAIEELLRDVVKKCA